MDHPPKNLEDGAIIYRGEEKEFKDKNLAADTSYYYTLFAEKDGIISQGISANASTRPPFYEGQENISWLPVLLLSLLVALIALLIILKRRKK